MAARVWSREAPVDTHWYKLVRARPRPRELPREVVGGSAGTTEIVVALIHVISLFSNYEACACLPCFTCEWGAGNVSCCSTAQMTQLHDTPLTCALMSYLTKQSLQERVVWWMDALENKSVWQCRRVVSVLSKWI